MEFTGGRVSGGAISDKKLDFFAWRFFVSSLTLLESVHYFCHSVCYGRLYDSDTCGIVLHTVLRLFTTAKSWGYGAPRRFPVVVSPTVPVDGCRSADLSSRGDI